MTVSYDGGEHGMTANSFTSVSLAPPVVLVCIHNDARMAFVLERGMEFGVSVLASDQEAISRHFAGRPQSTGRIEFAWHRGVPLIAEAAAQFICRLSDARIVGDHTLCLGEVEHLARFDRKPLVFYAGGYATLVHP